MADIDLVVESGDLQAAISLLKDYGVSFTQMVTKVQTEGNRLNRASKATTDQLTQAWQNAEKALETRKLEAVASKEQAILKRREQNWRQFFQSYGKNPSASQGGAPTSAAGSALLQQEKALSDAMLETAKAAKAKEREVALLTAKYNPLLAAEQAYVRMQKDISRATDIGVLDIKQQAAALDQLDAEYTALSNGVYMAGSRFNQFGEMAVRTGKNTQKFGMYAQQAGYQIGDFAVQLQSGANAGVAFSQQAAQLAGLIPGLAGALTTFAAIGAGLGIQAMIAFNEHGRKGKDIYEDLGVTLGHIEGLSFDNITGKLTASAMKIREEFQATFDLIERVEMKALKDNIDQPIREFEKQLWGFDFKSGIRNQVGAGDANFDYMGYKDAERAAQAFEYLRQIQGETREELAASLELQTRYLQGSGLLTTEVQARLAAMAQELGIVDSVATRTEELNSTVVQGYQYYQQQRQELLATLQLQELKTKYGENSLVVLDAIKNSALEEYRIQLALEGVHGTRADVLMGLLQRQIEIDQAAQRLLLTNETLAQQLYDISGIDISSVFARAEGIAGRLLGTVNAIGRGMSQLGKLGQEAQVLQAQNNALASGASPGEARVAGDVVRYGQELNIPDGPINNIMRGMLTKAYENQALENLTYNEEISTATSAWNKANNAKGGGGKKGGKEKLTDAEKDAEKASDKLQEFFEQYNKNIEQQERLLGIQGEQREALEKVIEIENRLGVARSLMSETQIAAMAREELALERRLDRERDIYQLGSSNVESLLMTVVEGTSTIEQAFKGMLSSIIAEVYQQYVAKGAADMAGNALISLFSANGNAFGPGGIKMFANGGVVGSPTLFGYGNGKTGMMGEAGPEAIMPLKRNSQGKLGVEVSGGNGGNVNVYHNINISANGDESVNKIITAQIPRITEASKRAVMDAKRRGQKGF
jgi:hypothetical protein